MKMKQLMQVMMAVTTMLWATAGMAFSPGNDYPCTSSHFEENLKNAQYIVVAKLEKYLPENQGEYRVLMNLRGDVQPGEAIIQFANPEPQTPEAKQWDDNSSDQLGHSYIFLGERALPIDKNKKLQLYQCNGRQSAETIECDWGYMCRTVKHILGE